ncbi:MAG: BatD family protein [Muribaculaceae bacterium]|nr:BatD family protein [Muribaculaceae bacterium]
MQIRKRLYALAVSLGICLAVTAQNVSFTIRLPQNPAVGERFQVVYRVNNGQPSSVPQAPQLAGCELVYGPSMSTSSSVQIIQGHQTSSTSIQYAYIYVAQKEGTVRVPDASVSVDGKTMTAKGGSFTVIKATQAQQQAMQQRYDPYADARRQYAQQAQQAQQPQAQTSNFRQGKDFLIRVNFSKNSVYEQEGVIAEIKIYTKHDITKFAQLSQPTFDGFLAEELPVNFSVTRENFNGDIYYTAVLKRLLLFPQKAGKLKLNTGKYEVTLQVLEPVYYGGFVSQRAVPKNISTETNAATIDIKPLPEPKPASFTGAVGKFTIKETLSPDQLRTNEAASYVLTVSGTGNLKYISAPEVTFPVGIDAYSVKTSDDVKVSGSTYTGSFTATYPLMPTEVGSYTIGAVDFSYFDPSTGQYQTLKGTQFDVPVGRGQETASAQKEVNNEMTDILHIYSHEEADEFAHGKIFSNWKYWAIYGGALVVLVVLTFMHGSRRKRNADVAGLKHSRARGVAKKKLQQAAKMMKAGNSTEFYQALAKALYGYLSDKLGIPPSALVRDTISERLTDAGASDELVKDVIQELDHCEMARFTPDQSAADLKASYENAAALIKNIEALKPHKKTAK